MLRWTRYKAREVLGVGSVRMDSPLDSEMDGWVTWSHGPAGVALLSEVASAEEGGGEDEAGGADDGASGGGAGEACDGGGAALRGVGGDGFCGGGFEAGFTETETAEEIAVGAWGDWAGVGFGPCEGGSGAWHDGGGAAEDGAGELGGP